MDEHTGANLLPNIAVEFLRENEGVNTIVICKDFDFPGEPFTIDLELLNDDSEWSDLFNEGSLVNVPGLLFDIALNKTAKKSGIILNELIKRREFSTRGLYISAVAIKENIANYTAWYYRSECLNRQMISFIDELNFTRKVTLESIKSYQPWNYRRNICKLAADRFNELNYVKLEIVTSPKNHCAWSHITWLVKYLGLSKLELEGELEFIRFLIDTDVYNNSVWNYKNYIIRMFKNELGIDFIIAELSNDFKLLLQKNRNESLTNYIYDLLSQLLDQNKCLNTNSCNASCTGPPITCVFNHLASLSETSIQLLTLAFNICNCEKYENVTNTALLQNMKKKISNSLLLHDPLRFDYWIRVFNKK